ncbi:hypothetical protein FoTM2_001836 [Fusarium oxysporum f. sp. vasinfectum]|nr:hypothetical protein FoTM2_001836 [Fusarium oxysporum f. sp. vasinfectum]
MPFPKTPGMDFGGRVVAIGPDILHIKTGDRVIGRMNPLNSAGSLSEYVVAAYDDIAVLPETVPLDQAGVAATAALTAYQSIVPFVKKGDKVFINGGSGGTGTFGIQIAKALGCHVTVSCSTAKVSLCRDLGGSNHKFEVFATKNSHEDMAQISTWMGEGKLKTVIDSTLAFEDLLKAYQKLKQGSARGKILVRVREGKRVIETVRDELN